MELELTKPEYETIISWISAEGETIKTEWAFAWTFAALTELVQNETPPTAVRVIIDVALPVK